MSLNSNKLRWGILGTAQIARKNWKAIHHTGNSTLVAVASRDVERSRQFIAECQAQVPQDRVPRAFGSYDELLASKEVDAVYIPLPTGLRKEWVLRAAAAGKHVVCEKPCATNVADLHQMLDACRRHRVQFMDGVMFMHSRRLHPMREVLDDPASIGRVRRITSAFSFCGSEEFFANNIRANYQLEPHGCLGDLGWYCLRFALWVMNGQLPQQVTGRILRGTGDLKDVTSVPTEFSGELFFEAEVSASFYCSFHTHDEQWAKVCGTQGYLELPDFVVPFFGHESSFRTNNTVLTVNGCDFDMEDHWRRFAVPEHGNSHPTAQETNLFRNFSDAVRSGILNDDWFDIALRTQEVMEACFESARNGSRLTERV